MKIGRKKGKLNIEKTISKNFFNSINIFQSINIKDDDCYLVDTVKETKTAQATTQAAAATVSPTMYKIACKMKKMTNYKSSKLNDKNISYDKMISKNDSTESYIKSIDECDEDEEEDESFTQKITEV